MENAIRIGNDRESTEAYVKAILDIISTKDVGELLKCKALDALRLGVSISHTRIQGCDFRINEAQEGYEVPITSPPDGEGDV